MTKKALWRMGVMLLSLPLVHFSAYTYAMVTGSGYPWDPALIRALVLPAYLKQLRNILSFDLQAALGEGTAQTLIQALEASAGLLALAFFLAVILGVFLGFLATRREGIAPWLSPIVAGGASMPSFYLGSLFIVAMIYYAIWRGPEAHIRIPLQGFGWDRHLFFPTLVLMMRPMVTVAAVTANQWADELKKPYVTAARSLGFPPNRLRGKFTFRNILFVLIPSTVYAFRQTLGELILVEWLFSWPGLGRLLVLTLVPGGLKRSLTGLSSSPLFMNPALTAWLLTFFALLFLLPQFFSTLILHNVDPRFRN